MHSEQNTFWVTCLLLIGGGVMWHFEPASADAVKLILAAVVGHWLGAKNGGKPNGNPG